jgi:hypothetical protein
MERLVIDLASVRIAGQRPPVQAPRDQRYALTMTRRASAVGNLTATCDRAGALLAARRIANLAGGKARARMPPTRPRWFSCTGS